MAAKIKVDRIIGLTDEADENLKIACQFTGMTISQYGRIAIIEKLCRDGFMQHPIMNRPRLKTEIAQAAE
jgi:hypothetical protein